MKATLIIATREYLDQGGFAELVVWIVPESLPGSTHPYKYRLAYVKHGHCVLRYDNEAGKGDHRHIDGREIPYPFTTLEALLEDFWADIRGC